MINRLNKDSYNKLAKTDKVKFIVEALNEADEAHQFWKTDAESMFDIIGCKAVIRNTVELVNPNGFTPYEKKLVEYLSKVFVIVLDENIENKQNNKEILAIKKEYEAKGIAYIKSNDPQVIINQVANFN